MKFTKYLVLPESINTGSCYCDHKQMTSPFCTSGEHEYYQGTNIVLRI